MTGASADQTCKQCFIIELRVPYSQKVPTVILALSRIYQYELGHLSAKIFTNSVGLMKDCL